MKIKGNNIMFCGSGDKGTGMLASGGVLHRLDSIEEYEFAYDVLQENSVLLDSDAIEDEFIEYVKTFDKYELSHYFCINCEIIIVCNRLNGDVLEWSTLSDFMWNLHKAWYDYNKT